MDYKQLLTKYMAYVARQEGITYVNYLTTYDTESGKEVPVDDSFTQAEVDELKAII